MAFDKERKKLLRRLYESRLPAEIAEAFAAGKRFIPVRDLEIEEKDLPEGYSLQPISFPDGRVYRAIIPTRALKHVGDKENPDELFDLYQEMIQHERGLIEYKVKDPGFSFFAQQVRDSFEVAMINSLLVDEGKIGQADFKEEVLQKYERRDDVNANIQQIAKLYSGLQQLDKVNLREVLKHITENIDVTVTKKVKCYKGSHWEWDVIRETKTIAISREKLETIGDLENQILETAYTDKPKDERELIRRKNELRSFINMRYLAKTGKMLPLITIEDENPLVPEEEKEDIEKSTSKKSKR